MKDSAADAKDTAASKAHHVAKDVSHAASSTTQAAQHKVTLTMKTDRGRKAGKQDLMQETRA